MIQFKHKLKQKLLIASLLASSSQLLASESELRMPWATREASSKSLHRVEHLPQGSQEIRLSKGTFGQKLVLRYIGARNCDWVLHFSGCIALCMLRDGSLSKAVLSNNCELSKGASE